MAKTGAGSRGGRIVTRRITRGKRKGQTVQGYMDANGRFTALKTNKSKGGARAGKKFVTTRDSKGRRVHTYVINGKKVSVTIKGSRKSKDKTKNFQGKSMRRSFARDMGAKRKSKRGSATARNRPKRKRRKKK